MVTIKATIALKNEEKQEQYLSRQKHYSKKDRLNEILRAVNNNLKNGLTEEEAAEKLTQSQFDFLVDCNIDTDDLFKTLTEQQKKDIQSITKVKRQKFINGYNKKYPQVKQNLFNNISNYIQSIGGTIEEKEKENFRDLIFDLDGEKYLLTITQKRAEKNNPRS